MEQPILQLYTRSTDRPWNKGKLIGQKPPLKLQEIWAMAEDGREVRGLLKFNAAGCMP